MNVIKHEGNTLDVIMKATAVWLFCYQDAAIPKWQLAGLAAFYNQEEQAEMISDRFLLNNGFQQKLLCNRSVTLQQLNGVIDLWKFN